MLNLAPINKVFNGLREWSVKYSSLSVGDYYANWNHRYLIYVAGAFLFGIWTFAAVEIYVEVHDKMAPGGFRGMYAWHTVLNFGFCLYLMDEWLSRLWPEKGNFEERTVGKLCLIWFVGFIIAFFIQRTLVYQASELYYPKIILFYEQYPEARPSALKMFFYLLPFWMITVFILIQISLRGQRLLARKRLEIDQFLEKREKELASAYRRTRVASSPLKTTLAIPFQNGIRKVHSDDISHITVEDHYCRIHTKSNHEVRNDFVKISLKNMLKRLPSDQFIQIHRSHVINIAHISQVKKRNRSFELVLKHGDHKLPVSRYRLPKVMPYIRSLAEDDS